MSGGLVELLDTRLKAERLSADQPVTVAELHKRLVPYHVCRERLGYASKAEYDGQVLSLLADERRIAVSDPALREAVRVEMEQPEPGLGFLHRFAATEILRLAADDDRDRTDGPDGLTPDLLDLEPLDPEPLDPEPPIPTAEGRAACRDCGVSLPPVEGARFCPSCGADQRVPECPGCGEDVNEDWRYCAFCGILQAREPGIR